MSKERIKITLVVLSMVACIVCAIISLPIVLKASRTANKRTASSPVYEGQHMSPVVPNAVWLKASGMQSTYRSARGVTPAPQPMPDFHPAKQGTVVGSSPFTCRLSSATVHSIGGGGSNGTNHGASSARQTLQPVQPSGTIVPLLAVNTSAFSVNRELNDMSGKSVAGVAARRISPPDDGGSGIGGPGNIAPPDDGGELLGSPVGEMPMLWVLVLCVVYGLSVRRIRKKHN